ncbi:transposase [Paenibacillus sp. D9]|uniref:IS5 family transposase n=1 Tax=Paenibacillus sp. D9 TaxID=665792 RepID=UPI00061F5AB3|nr:IS5 family transposase [Paenibacillus sp. D9]KKC47751.1 transposase [Paenibacillus sp. D9]
MYQPYAHEENQLLLPSEFFLPFGGCLNPNNRWIKLAQMIPWARVDRKYAKSFKKSFRGQKAISVRMALGALIIQERLQQSDRETVETIIENPYLQYFLGLAGYQDRPPFHHSLMTHFRKRLGEKVIAEVNEWIAVEAAKAEQQRDDDDDATPSSPVGRKAKHKRSEPDPNQGTLLLDATCAPADIAYPTDITLLNEAREKLETIIDALHEPHVGQRAKPRTYREKARRSYLSLAKQRRIGYRALRRGISKQLAFIKRDLHIIEGLASITPLTELSRRQYKQLLVIQELYRQQRLMYTKRVHHVEDRIVSIHQPHIRPIVRGKAKAKVEFGAKVSVSMVQGFAFLERWQWDNFNEGVTLIESVETYKARFGVYPKEVMADQIYRNRENRAYCKERGIRLSGPPLGRPSKQADTAVMKRMAKLDAGERNAIEGKFGEGKRKYGLNRIRARLEQTSGAVIALQFLVMNLERRLRLLFVFIFNILLNRTSYRRFAL